MKLRFNNSFIVDTSRVMLTQSVYENGTGNDYINAVYVDVSTFIQYFVKDVWSILHE